MQNPDHLNLDVLKIVNRLYEMRFFLTAPQCQAEKFNKWLYLCNENQQLINKEHLAAITQFTQSFREVFTDSNHLDNFYKKLLGEEVGKNAYHSGLLQNKPQGIYYFLIKANNNAITEFLIHHLHTLDAAFESWQTYQNQYANIGKLISECKNEIDKKCVKNATSKMARDVTKKIQHTINKSKMIDAVTSTPTTSSFRPLITLSNPEELPTLNQLIRRMYSASTETLFPYTEKLINLRNSFSSLTGINHLAQLFLLDKCIFQCLFYNIGYSEKKLLHSYLEILAQHLLTYLTPYASNKSLSPQTPDYELNQYIVYTKQIIELANNYLRSYYSFNLANLNLNLMIILCEITQDKILEEDDIIDPDVEDDFPSTQESNGTRNDNDDLLETRLSPSQPPENLQLEVTADGIIEFVEAIPSLKDSSSEDTPPQHLKRRHALKGDTDSDLDKDKENNNRSHKKSRLLPKKTAVARRLNSDLPDQSAVALERRGLFRSPLQRKCTSISVITPLDPNTPSARAPTTRF